jgi:hypothetical protein
MDLKLSIKADYEQASKAFKELANSSDEVRAKMEKFSDSFKTEQIDKFIDRQKITEIAMQGTRGEVAAMTTAQKNYEKEIERLIRSGLDPESEAIQRLRDEHDKLASRISSCPDLPKAACASPARENSSGALPMASIKRLNASSFELTFCNWVNNWLSFSFK